MFTRFILGGRFRARGHNRISDSLLDWSVAQWCVKVNQLEAVHMGGVRGEARTRTRHSPRTGGQTILGYPDTEV
jgi:hypothetical protein